MGRSERHIAVVGPSEPDRGGIVQHTAELVERLDRLEPTVSLHSWERQFPRRLAPPAGADPSPVGHATAVGSRLLMWNRPDTWLRVGRHLASQATDLVLVLSDPRQAPAMAAIAAAYRHGRRRRGLADDARVRMIVHNVLPHEPSRAAGWLAPLALRIADRTVVHSAAQSDAARRLGAVAVVRATLPLHLGAKGSGPAAASETPHGRLCFIGHVREYKGLDLLIDALGRTSTRPRLEVRGVFWRAPQAFLARAREAGVADLVELYDAFASDDELLDCLDRSDALVLPYRSATGTQQPRLAFSRRVPVIASDVGGLAEQVNHGRDGLVFPAGDVAALARCIDELARPGVAARLRQGIVRPDPDREWAEYLDVLLGDGEVVHEPRLRG